MVHQQDTRLQENLSYSLDIRPLYIYIYIRVLSGGNNVIKKIILAAAIVIISIPALTASLYFSPKDYFTENEAVTVYISAFDLIYVTGFDLTFTWNSDVFVCSSIIFSPGALPGFAQFRSVIDNDAGYIEAVLLKQTPGGYTGAADSFLALTFEPYESGTTDIVMHGVNEWGDPVLINSSNESIEVELDTATVTGAYVDPVPDITMVRLYQNYPNPFNPATKIRFDIPDRSPVKLKVYDVAGRLVSTLLDGDVYEEGTWTVDWEGSNNEGRKVPSGVYFCVIEACGRQSSRKIVVLR
jgi:hypothetical protein